MKKRIRLTITFLIIALVICVLTWRFLPHPSSYIISMDKTAITSFSAYAMVSCFENGQSEFDTYRIDITEPQSNESAEIMEIVSTSGYQQDFRNL